MTPWGVPSADASHRMPASFRQGRPMTRSLGHFSSTGRPLTSTTASATATPAAIVTRGTWAPRPSSLTMIDRYMPAPGGEAHDFPRRPRPARCSSASTEVNSAAPSAARDRASSFVEPIDGTCTIGGRPARATAAARSPLKESATYASGAANGVS
jgi:hypothetical protein